VIDGVHASERPFAPPDSHEASPLTDRDIVEVTTVLRRRILRYLQRRDRLPRAERDREQDESPDSEREPDERLYAEPCAASIQGRVALGPQRGAPVEHRGRRHQPDQALFLPGELCCDIEGLSLHAKVALDAGTLVRTDRVGIGADGHPPGFPKPSGKWRW